MKTNISQLIFLTSIVFTVFFVFKPKTNTSKNTISSAKEKMEEKLYPYDFFWQERTYPYKEPDIAAYRAAMLEAKQFLQTRRSTIGFDKDWVTEGPGNIGARINSIATHPTNNDITYVGYERGGLWKTTNNGQSWSPIFDNEINLGISNIAIQASNPDILYVGTGDANINSHAFNGHGVYKSTNGGQTWTHIGLDNIIARVEIHPSNPAIIYAAAMGNPFIRDNNRGLYKSVDGGQTWNQVLFVDTQTGIIDMAIHPQNPQIIYAASWTRIRNDRESIASGTECKVWKTTDGGQNWTVLAGGLPVGVPHSRIGLAICPNAPNTVYAEYIGTDYQLENVYKTTDNGSTWAVVPTIANGVDMEMLGGFGWYFGKIRVSPTDCNTIHLLGIEMWSTFNGGQVWTKTVPDWFTYEVHADKHDLVYKPNGNILLATDGGLYETNDFSTWIDKENIPTTQFYRVAYNPHRPEVYYGGAQDNGTSSGNALSINAWERLWGGDGFQARFNPADSLNFYYSSQFGNVYGSDAGNLYSLQGNVSSVSLPNERFNWNTPYILSRFDPNIIYYGGERLYKSVDRGLNWQVLSPNLTGIPDFTANWHTIGTISESPIQPDKIFVGVSAGLLWRTADGGITWDSIHQNGLPRRFLSCVQASTANPNSVFVSFSGYRLNDNTPHIFRSTNNGNSWVSIAGNLPNIAINDILIIPNTNDQTLFVATDAGVYGTINGGVFWERVGTNMPMVVVFDLEYNPVLNRIIAGSFSRSIMSYPLSELLTVKGNIQEEIALKIYPNPAENIIQIETDMKLIEGKMCAIYDMQGRKVYSSYVHSTQKTISIEGLPTGNYVLQVLTEKGWANRKFVKK